MSEMTKLLVPFGIYATKASKLKSTFLFEKMTVLKFLEFFPFLSTE